MVRPSDTLESPWKTLDILPWTQSTLDQNLLILGSNQINKFKFKVSLKYNNYETEKTKTLKNEKASLFLNGLS
jgi:hypothetical protein